MQTGELITYLGICLALNILPGPDMLLIASRSVTGGRLIGFATYAGVAAGVFCHALAVALGLGALFAVVPSLYVVLKLCGVAYLVYLGVQAIQQGVRLDANGVGGATKTALNAFGQGLLTNLLNPKVFFFMLAFLPQFIHPENGQIWRQALVLAFILNSTGLLVNGAVIVMANYLRVWLVTNSNKTRREKHLGWFQGGVMFILALLLLRSGRG